MEFVLTEVASIEIQSKSDYFVPFFALQKRQKYPISTVRPESVSYSSFYSYEGVTYKLLIINQ